MACAWMVFGLMLPGLEAGIDQGGGAKDLPPALEDMARIRWMIPGDSLALILAVLHVVAGSLGVNP